MNDLPQGRLAAAGLAIDVGPTSGVTELDVITAGAASVAGTGRVIRITFHARGIDATVANDTYELRIKEGATILNTASFSAPSTLIESTGVDFSAIISPTVGSHTYKVTIIRAGGTGTATIRGSATANITLTVEDIGQV